MTLEIPTPPHAIGLTLFYPSLDSTTAIRPCPDCLGTKTWKVITPAGYELEAACHRCSSNFSLPDLPSLKHVVFTPAVRSFTIRSIVVSSHNRWSLDEGDTRITYYDQPGNVGTVMHPAQFFDTEAEAMVAAQSMADAKNLAQAATDEALTEKRFANMVLPDAVSTKWNQDRWGYYWVHIHFRRTIQEMIDAEEPWTVDDMLRTLKWEMEYDAKRKDEWPDMLRSLDKAIELLRAASHDLHEFADTTTRGEIETFLESITPAPALPRTEETA